MSSPVPSRLHDHHPVIVCSCALTHLTEAVELMSESTELKDRAHRELHPSAPDPEKAIELLVEVAEYRTRISNEVRLALAGAQNRCGEPRLRDQL